MNLTISALSWSEANRSATRSRLFVSMPANVRDLPRVKQIALVKSALRPMLRAGTELKFSQKCGCSCGCSPGFVVGGVPFKGMPARFPRDKRSDVKLTHFGVCDAHVTFATA